MDVGAYIRSPLLLFQDLPHNEVADADADHLQGGGEPHGRANRCLTHHKGDAGPHAGLVEKKSQSFD